MKKCSVLITFALCPQDRLSFKGLSFHVCKEDFEHKLNHNIFYYNKYEIFLHKIYKLSMIHSCSLDSSACNILVGGISSS